MADRSSIFLIVEITRVSDYYLVIMMNRSSLLLLSPKRPFYNNIGIATKRTTIPLLSRWQSSLPTTPPASNNNGNSNVLYETSKLTESEKATLGCTDDSEELELTTGVIHKNPREGLLYYDTLYPRWTRFCPVGMEWIVNKLLGLESRGLQKVLSARSIPEGYPVSLTKVITRVQDGGVFARYTMNNDGNTLHSEHSYTSHKIENTLAERFNEVGYRPWYSFESVRVFPVRGMPWVEDLRRTRNSKINVTFEGMDISQEALYSIFRRYGPIVDIVPPSPGDPTPHVAKVEFSRKTNAATARNCVNGLSLKNGKTKLHISFETVIHQNVFKKWILEHPRIVIPVLFALLATLAVLIFEPIRIFSIRHKITNRFVALDGYPKLNKLKKMVTKFFGKLHGYVDDSITFIGWRDANSSGEMDDIWEARKESIHTLKRWIDEGVGTFIVVYGPKGSGKDVLVRNQTLAQRENVLTIDCESLVNSRSDSTFLKSASKSLGYYPVFPWMNSISTFLDLIAQGITGQKTGFAESIESQFKNMLSTATTAVGKTALEKRIDNQDRSNENYLQLHPENKPVVVIRNFKTRSEERSKFVYTQLAEWAATLIQANIAHVVFVTDDVAYEKILEEALPNQVFKVLPIGNTTFKSARNYVLEQIAADRNKKRLENEQEAYEDILNSEKLNKQNLGMDTESQQPIEQPALLTKSDIYIEGLDEALIPIGGRMTDLQAFARRLKSGESPKHAVNDMIEQAKVEVLLMFVTKSTDCWTKEQAWTIIKNLASQQEKLDNSSDGGGSLLSNLRGKNNKGNQLDDEEDEPQPIWLPFSYLCQDTNFSTPQQQKGLYELENVEMIKLHTETGRIISVRAGKPLYQAAFRSLADDANLSAWMESQILKTVIKEENTYIHEYEKELVTLAQLPSKWEIKARINYISTLMYGCQERIEDYEKRLQEQKDIIQKTKNN